MIGAIIRRGGKLVVPAIVLQGLRYTYRGSKRPALDQVDLTVDQGELVVVLGPSGAGKSTLCLTLNGLIPHFVRGELVGEVWVYGEPTSQRKVSQLARQVALVFQDFESQLFSTNVELEVAFGPENFGLPHEEIGRRIKESLETVRLIGLEKREPATLSGGQKQRLAIASVLSLHPRMICMDEPTTDLDPIGKEGVFAVARRLKEREEITLVIAEHETEEALVADRVIVLDQGKVVANGAPSEVLSRPQWLESLGVHPLGCAALGARLGLDPIPLTVEEAAAALDQGGWRLDRSRLVDPVRPAGAPIIEVESLTHTYPNGVKALTGASLTIREGEFVAVVGQNGSGKTTLVKHFNGLLMPTEGQVLVEGQGTRNQTVGQLGKAVGYVFQNPDHQIFAETVFDEVAFAPRNHGLAEAEVRERVQDALAAVGLAGRDQEDPFSLTKGERQRVAVASILAQRPPVIILDEPTTGLDYQETCSMMELVKQLNEQGHTIIAVTHTMWVVAAYAHRVVVVHDGRILLDGPTREVMAREEELRVASLKPSQIVRLGNRLGAPLLTVDEAAEALVRG